MKTGAAVLALAALITFAPPAQAQRFELGFNGGYFVPTTTLFRRVIPLPSSTGFFEERRVGRNDPGAALGLNLAAWLRPSLGVDISTSLRFSDRSSSSPPGPSATIALYSIRLVTKTELGGLKLRASVGPALVRFGGAAYAGSGSNGGLAKQTFTAGVVALDVSRTIAGLRCRLGLEDAIYRVSLVPLPPGDTSSTPLQHDLVITAGVAIPLR